MKYLILPSLVVHTFYSRYFFHFPQLSHCMKEFESLVGLSMSLMDGQEPTPTMLFGSDGTSYMYNTYAYTSILATIVHICTHGRVLCTCTCIQIVDSVTTSKHIGSLDHSSQCVTFVQKNPGFRLLVDMMYGMLYIYTCMYVCVLAGCALPSEEELSVDYGLESRLHQVKQLRKKIEELRYLISEHFATQLSSACNVQ